MSTRYTDTHEWVRIEGDVAIVGITEYAQEQLGDVVFVELPAKGQEVTRGEEVAVVESVKAASEVVSPVSGVVLEINDRLAEEPRKVNHDPHGDGWFFKLKAISASEFEALMDQTAYEKYLKGSGDHGH